MAQKKRPVSKPAADERPKLKLKRVLPNASPPAKPPPVPVPGEPQEAPPGQPALEQPAPQPQPAAAPQTRPPRRTLPKKSRKGWLTGVLLLAALASLGYWAWDRFGPAGEAEPAPEETVVDSEPAPAAPQTETGKPADPAEVAAEEPQVVREFVTAHPLAGPSSAPEPVLSSAANAPEPVRPAVPEPTELERFLAQLREQKLIPSDNPRGIFINSIFYTVGAPLNPQLGLTVKAISVSPENASLVLEDGEGAEHAIPIGGSPGF